MRFILALSLFWPAVAASAQSTGTESAPQDVSTRLDALEQKLSDLEGKPSTFFFSQFNPAIGMAIDTLVRDDDGQGGVQLRSAELNLDAAVDPFLKAYAVITGSSGGSPNGAPPLTINCPTQAGIAAGAAPVPGCPARNSPAIPGALNTNNSSPQVDVEEAAAQTTKLPYGLTLKGGRFFVDFGRQAHWHDHELNTTERPNSLNEYIGAEAQGDGAELSWIVPTDLYINATVGAFNKIGANNNRADNTTLRSFNEFTYLARLSTYKDIGENFSAELGVDSAWTPKESLTDDLNDLVFTNAVSSWRTLNGVDMTLRYQPVNGGLYHGAIWGTEVMQNNERRILTPFGAAPPANVYANRVTSYAGFSYAEAKLGRRVRPGVMVDLTQDLDDSRHVTRTYAAYVNYDVSEFQRVRLQYSRIVNGGNIDGVPGLVNNAELGALSSNNVALQWTFIIGSHVHGFKDR